ncbi:helix-turn-helix domain-containing protein [Amycolatopsis sp. NPDC049159]|uniref:helix-turn-helix domain-containing protein n=1 Tax=Amycolatopsis sp. NPDC049159 TaxID=3157210 RepID=UPI003410A2CB
MRTEAANPSNGDTPPENRRSAHAHRDYRRDIAREATMPEGDAWAEIMRNLGSDLHELRVSAHLTQEEVAQRMGGRQQSWVSEVEKGNRRGRPISWEDVSSWLEACGVGAGLLEDWRVRYTPIEWALDLRRRRGTGPKRRDGREPPALPSETIRITEAIRQFKAVFFEELDAAREQARQLKSREEQLTSQLTETTGKMDDLKLQCHQAEQQITTDGQKEQHLRDRIRGLRQQLRADDETIHLLEKEIRFTREQRRIAEQTTLRMSKRTAEVALRSRTASDLLTVLFEATWANRHDERAGGEAPDDPPRVHEERKTTLAGIPKPAPLTTTWPSEVGRSRTLISTLSIIAVAVLLAISLLALVF